MSEMTLNCPLCHADVLTDTQYAGQQIQCPVCAGQITVTLSSAPRRAGLKVSAEQTHNTAPMPESTDFRPPLKVKSRIPGLILTITVWLAVIGAGLYFGWPWIKKMQAKFSSSVEENAKSGGGGQIGHIGELNAVLDATEPKYTPMTQPTSSPEPNPDGTTATSPVPTNAPTTELIPPVYTIEVDSSEIPKGNVNGVIAKEKFVADTVIFDYVSGAYVLNLRQGTNQLSPREIFVYIRPKKDEKIEGGSWVISKYVRTGGPQILKKWQTRPPYVTQKSFATGYALKLELGDIVDASLPGKIYLALPDEDQTVIAGNFVARTRLASKKTPPPAAPAP